ncbi:MAG: shikimate kinase, partial [Clostridia bacterium]|nr:shikimate kinase [Clostridia bacterium]
YLKKNGVVVYINRSVEHILKTLKTDNRPLLKENPLKLYDMYEERHDLYLKYADVVVSNGSDFKSGVQNVYDAIKEWI